MEGFAGHPRPASRPRFSQGQTSVLEVDVMYSLAPPVVEIHFHSHSPQASERAGGGAPAGRPPVVPMAPLWCWSESN